ncbi:MAG: glycosyltransferase [Candidatus Aureabacteria bacterium]|nr:glycosyltransferase [Candidatus Auribacterota bacterium]
MKISVITVVYNNKAVIEDAIRSVLSQNYKDIEYIIIDGASTDGTLNIIDKYKKKISRVVSEKDNGTYDAMNKGLKLATGDIVGCLNSDDFYANNNVISTVAKVFSERKVDCCYSDLDYVSKNKTEKVVRKWKSRYYEDGLFRKGWHPPHPTLFIKKDVYRKYGYFNLDLKIGADYELMLRFLEKHRINSYYIPEVLIKMRIGGSSNRSIMQILKANYECYKAFKINGMKPNLLIIFYKLLSKIKQIV